MYKLHGKRYAYRFNIEEIKGMNLNQSWLHVTYLRGYLSSVFVRLSKTILNLVQEKKKDEGLMELAN